MAIVVFVNPGSRANRKDPRCADRFASILGDCGRIAAPATLPLLTQEAHRVAAESPSVIGIHGGDGTLHRTLSALVLAYGERPLPPVAILPGGTMNVVSASLGIRVKPEALLAELSEFERKGLAPPTLRRRCLRIGTAHGFIFGNGLLTNFLQEYYARGSYGAWRALWIIARLLVSVFTTRRYAQRIFRRFRGHVSIDGAPLPVHELTGIGVATVSEIGFRLKLHHRADDDPDRMGGIAIHGRPLSLLLDVLRVRLGHGLSPKRAASFVASRLYIEPTDAETVYTMDGDLYPCTGPITIEVGPVLRIVKPQGC